MASSSSSSRKSEVEFSLPVIDISSYVSRGSSRDPRGIPVSDCKLVSRSLKEFGAFIVKDIRWSLPDYDIFHEDIETFFKSLSNTPHLQKQFGVPEEVPMTSVYFWKFARRPENNAPVKDYGVSNVTPCGFPDWNPTMDNWSFNMLGIACMVAEMAAIGFGLPVDAFTSRIHYGLHTLATIGSNLGKDVQEGTILQACHHNFNFLTIHGRNKFHGLHIWLRNAARVEVKIPVGCFVIQAGKQLEWLTGGACLATNHDIVVTKTTMDVINKMKERDCSLWRVSSSLYVHALSDAILKPLEPFDKHTVKMANDYPPVPAEYVVREYAEMRHAMQKKILEGDGSSVS
ncbi:uncharacterized protein [Cicer arietinum]|uniref:Uncharacterized protein LOC101503347 n=1 Tax=Cicer arietinum TaxID=3827 RepID=A0A1S2YWP2_CICAR|nr:uncharacterized protein LOC101503347 [Cicer arietinum]